MLCRSTLATQVWTLQCPYPDLLVHVAALKRMEHGNGRKPTSLSGKMAMIQEQALSEGSFNCGAFRRRALGGPVFDEQSHCNTRCAAHCL